MQAASMRSGMAEQPVPARIHRGRAGRGGPSGHNDPGLFGKTPNLSFSVRGDGDLAGGCIPVAVSRWRRSDCEAAAQREQVRFQAAELLAQGVAPPKVARRLRVSRKSADAWHARRREAGISALRSKELRPEEASSEGLEEGPGDDAGEALEVGSPANSRAYL
nr:helix-turn-helix domain-containing protein [Streptomyces coffeae]